MRADAAEVADLLGGVARLAAENVVAVVVLAEHVVALAGDVALCRHLTVVQEVFELAGLLRRDLRELSTVSGNSEQFYTCLSKRACCYTCTLEGPFQCAIRRMC